MINSLQTRTVESALLEDTITPWLGPLAPWTRRVVIDNEERARLWIAICMALSMLLHLSLLLIPMTKVTSASSASSQVQGPLTVHLANPAPRAPAAPTPPPPVLHLRPIMAMRHPSSRAAPTFTVPPPPQEMPPEPTAHPEPPVDDISARLEARRAARRAAEAEAAQ